MLSHLWYVVIAEWYNVGEVFAFISPLDFHFYTSKYYRNS
jgi:hypothetical protein